MDMSKIATKLRQNYAVFIVINSLFIMVAVFGKKKEEDC